MPVRIQRKRTKGWRMPENTVYVGRPGKWGNPFKVDIDCTATQAVSLFERRLAITAPTSLLKIKEELKGKDLSCWCPLNKPCHADVLLKIANDE